MTSASRASADPLPAIRLKLFAALLSALIAAAIRSLGPEIPVGEVVFFRSFIAVVTLATIYAARGQLRPALRTSAPLGHFSRSLSGAVSTSSYVGALARLPLVDVTVITYSAPIMTVALAAAVLKEGIGIYRWTATFIGFGGILIMLWPYLDASRFLATAAGIGAMLALLSALTSATSAIQIRRLTKTETTTSIIFYFYTFCASAAALTLPFWWEAPTPEQYGLLILIGSFSALSQFASTESFRRAGASITAFFDYTVILWAFFIGYFIFGELPTAAICIGGAIVVGSGLFIMYREWRLKTIATPGSAVIGS